MNMGVCVCRDVREEEECIEICMMTEEDVKTRERIKKINRKCLIERKRKIALKKREKKSANKREKMCKLRGRL